MTTINIYDIDAENLYKTADANDTTIAEMIWLLMDYMDDYAKTMFLYEDKVWAVWGDFLYGMRIADGKVVVFQKAPGDWKGD